MPTRRLAWRPSSILIVVLVLANVVMVRISLTRPEDDLGPPRASLSGQGQRAPQMPRAGSASGSGSGVPRRVIKVEHRLLFAEPFEGIGVKGRYVGVPHTVLKLQYRKADRWQDFPLTVRTDKSGRFRGRVELGEPGTHTLRVLDPESGVTSKRFVLEVG
jgi:hypothetical protein